MEDHVGRILGPVAALLAALAAAAALLAFAQALKPEPGSPEWAALGALAGLLAPFAARRAAGRFRSVALAAAVIGVAVAVILAGEAAWVLRDAFVAGGPETAI